MSKKNSKDTKRTKQNRPSMKSDDTPKVVKNKIKNPYKKLSNIKGAALAKMNKKVHKQHHPLNIDQVVKRETERKEKKYEKKLKKKNKQDEPEITPDNKENFFIYDTDTNIMSKLQGQKSLKKKNLSWNYNSIIDEEHEIQKTKMTKKEKEKESEMNKAVNEKMEVIDEENFNEENINLTKYENELYSSTTKFTDFNVTKLLLRACSDLEFYVPTKVQERVVPVILKGHDVLVNSETGSGKTACYLMPIIQRIYEKKNSKNEVKALIILPTRELVFQCTQMLSSLLKYLDFITFVSVSGGMSGEKQEAQLKTKPDIIIATPGRLIDLIYNHKAVSVENINIVVLDEADKLLELGFKDAIFEITSLISTERVQGHGSEVKNRQTLLFSATLNAKVVDLEKHALKNPVKVKLVHSAVLSNLKQCIVRMKFKSTDNSENNFEKRMAYVLFLLISGECKTRTIIFFNTKSDCHKAAVILTKYKLKCSELHGDIPQPMRLKSLNEFQTGDISFLLATDVAARGIDIEKVKYVINFQMPVEMDRYIHRIGRTARKGYIGSAITICDEEDRLKLKKLSKKENFVLNLIKIENDHIKMYFKNCLSKKSEVKQVLEQDKVEKELKKFETDVQRSINISEHKKEILNRPKKTWYKSKGEEKMINKKVKNNLGAKDFSDDDE